ncbi:SH3 domain-containing protein [Clostridium sp. MSJ-4]|uniref:SH3 domain-containing protein n=1 Tax=Clostridium simiarum TaxID=2841506 RepID=A0ABS6F3U6_9CLOT|nr:SH3 domain-containing protein [Clostridium simiarum]
MNKKKISIFLLSTSIISGTSFLDKPTYAVENDTTKVKEVKIQSSTEVKVPKGEVINVSTKLNLRESPSTDSSIIGHLIKGEQFDIKGKSDDWYNVDFNGKVGYIHKNFVKELNSNTESVPKDSVKETPVATKSPSENPSVKSPASAQGEVTNVSTSLRIRDNASTNSNIVGYLKNGDKLTIKGSYGDWYNIEFNGTSGYAHKDYIKKIESDTTKPPVETPNENKSSKGEVINVSTNLRMRKEPNTNSTIISYLINGQSFNINGKVNDWYFIEFNDKVGYIHKDYVKVLDNNTPSNPNPEKPSNPDPSIPGEVLEDLGLGMVYNVSTNLRLRSKPSTDSNSQVLGYLLPGATFNIIGTSGQWYKVKYAGKIGYLNKSYVKKVSDSEIKNPSNNNDVYNIAFNAMKAHIGSPYVWGGSGELLTTASLNVLKSRYPYETQIGKYDIPSSYIDAGYRAFDCSGLMQWGLKQAGVNIGRSTWDQIKNGVEVSRSDIKPGDLLFFNDLNHVGMYVGDGKWIESPNSRNFVRIIDVPWYKIGRIRRVI